MRVIKFEICVPSDMPEALVQKLGEAIETSTKKTTADFTKAHKKELGNCIITDDPRQALLGDMMSRLAALARAAGVECDCPDCKKAKAKQAKKAPAKKATKPATKKTK